MNFLGSKEAIWEDSHRVGLGRDDWEIKIPMVLQLERVGYVITPIC